MIKVSFNYQANRYIKKHPFPAVLTAGNSLNLKLALATFFT
ncbi:hypothetical protein Gilli_0675 [Gillisia limnaea DSM 15749]|uniref:Uncharacterized protein n=1 Tax=Gillisia limnaea (strain DSM 15749 / LMG 21470 / R-8282) TaxID=865937 RepID=H2BRS1_GILLR|nr:hypothetical protein Gilli_0675 [Gillisia limnaea DSM 15749]